MFRQQNASTLEGEGVECLLGGDTDVFSTASIRLQPLSRLGFPGRLAALIAPLTFGEAQS